MKYLLAVFCPPLAMLACRKWVQALTCAVPFVFAIAWAESALGPLVAFFLILWAFHVVGDHDAGIEARAFVQSVRPIPVRRG
jgi:hypothetical protein